MNYLWLDLETTGSDETVNHIIEIGCIVTDESLFTLASYDTMVEPPTWAGMSDVVARMHLHSGLLGQFSRIDPPSIDEVESALLEWLHPHLTHGKIILAGSGVGHFDRRFIRAQMPKLDKRLSFAPFDVGQVRRFLTLAGVVQRPAEDPKTHRAYDDIKAHLNEARRYIETFKSLR